MRTETIKVVDRDDRPGVIHIAFSCAMALFREGKIEQVFDRSGNFVGVRLLESKAKSRDEVYRSSMIDSDSCLTEKDSLGNVGALSEKANHRAADRVQSWPLVHDTFALTICAGRVYEAC